MKALFNQPATQDAVRQKQVFSQGRSPGISPLSSTAPLLQRQCACGGGCPRCREELGLQTKLKISEPGDQYEQEADRIADEVMRMPEPKVQRQVEPEEEDDEERVKRQAIAPESAPRTQKQELSGVPSIIREAIKSLGQPLDAGTRSFMESRFGYDFAPVRIYPEHSLASRIQAHAFTIGSDIFFAPGEFQPSTLRGQRLISHELTHTIQQGAVPMLAAGQLARSPISPRISHAPASIQREVGENEVASSEQVLSRIGSRTVEADAHATAVVRALRNLNQVVPTIPGTPSAVADLRSQIAEPIFAALVGDLFRLGETGFLEFNPGAGRDSPQNAFVYTCKCGWIDMGHFFISAALSFALEAVMQVWSNLGALLGGVSAQEAALIVGWHMEHLQEAFRQFATGPLGGLLSAAPESIRAAVMGNVRSAFTVEDLPSDAYGSRFGHQVAVALAMSNSMGIGDPEADDIQNRMSDFFSDCVAVFPTGQTRTAMIEETVGTDPLPRQHFSTTPVLLTSALGLCPVPETACPPVDERGWERAHPRGMVDEEADRTTLWNFAVDISALKTEHQQRLRQAAVAAPVAAMVMVEGYASCSGSSALNERLARSRAESASAFLRAQRSDLRVGTNYFGERTPRPPVTAGDGEAMARNRRVEIYVINVPRTPLDLPRFQLPTRGPLPMPATEAAPAGADEGSPEE